LTRSNRLTIKFIHLRLCKRANILPRFRSITISRFLSTVATSSRRKSTANVHTRKGEMRVIWGHKNWLPIKFITLFPNKYFYKKAALLPSPPKKNTAKKSASTSPTATNPNPPFSNPTTKSSNPSNPSLSNLSKT
jgi:hypothetical protein